MSDNETSPATTETQEATGATEAPKLYYLVISGKCRRCGTRLEIRSPLRGRRIGNEDACKWGGCNGGVVYDKIEHHEAHHVPKDRSLWLKGEFFTASDLGIQTAEVST